MVKVSVCVGSACHVNGAYGSTEVFQKALSQPPYAGKVELSASFCMGGCKDGPCFKIDDVRFEHVTAQRAEELIQQEILPKIG